MKVDIYLHKRNRSALVKLCKRLFTNFNYVKVSEKTVIFKTKWYSLEKISMTVVDLVFLRIPYAINERHEECEIKPIFKENVDLHSAVEYFGVKSLEGDIISFLKYNLDQLEISISLNEEIH